MNPTHVYMCSTSWTLLPPPSPYHPSGSTQCTSPKHPVSSIEPGLVAHFIHDTIHVSMPFSQIFPPSPSPTESIRLFYTLVSLLLSRIQAWYFFKKEILLLSPEKIKTKIMTFLRRSNSRNQILVAEHHWTPPGHLPNSRSGTGKELSESRTSNCASSKKLHKDLWTNDLRTKEPLWWGAHWWHLGRLEHQKESRVKTSIAHRVNKNPWSPSVKRWKEQKYFPPGMMIITINPFSETDD